MKDTYKITVEFERHISEDAPFIKERGRAVTPATLKKQFKEELQEAYDAGILAGFFNIVSIEVDN